MMRWAALWGFPAALLMTFCSFANLDYLRDATCAPTCGADAASEAGDAASVPEDGGGEGGLAPAPCGADGGYRVRVLCDRPAAYWRLGDPGPPMAKNEVDGGAGAYVATDTRAISYGVAGAITNDPDPAVRLDGKGFVSVGNALSFPGNAPFAIEAWVSPDGDNFSYRRIVQRLVYDPAGKPLEGYIVYNQQTFAAERYVDGGVSLAVGPPLGNLAYSHVVVTFDGGALRIYVNGALTQTVAAAGSAADTGATFFIGGDGQNSGAGWVGALDEIAVYAYALEPDQVAAHFRAGRAP
jgi:hypothetical protein